MAAFPARVNWSEAANNVFVDVVNDWLVENYPPGQRKLNFRTLLRSGLGGKNAERAGVILSLKATFPHRDTKSLVEKVKNSASTSHTKYLEWDEGAGKLALRTKAKGAAAGQRKAVVGRGRKPIAGTTGGRKPVAVHPTGGSSSSIIIPTSTKFSTRTRTNPTSAKFSVNVPGRGSSAAGVPNFNNRIVQDHGGRAVKSSGAGSSNPLLACGPSIGAGGPGISPPASAASAIVSSKNFQHHSGATPAGGGILARFQHLLFPPLAAFPSFGFGFGFPPVAAPLAASDGGSLRSGPSANKNFYGADPRRMEGEGTAASFRWGRPAGFSPFIWDERKERLSECGTITLFHATLASSAEVIEREGRLLRGTVGIAGGGIYFATSQTLAVHKCRAKFSSKTCSYREGVVVFECRVRLGKRKCVKRKSEDITFSELLRAGYDSTEIIFLPTVEYAVYNSDQCEIVRRINQ